MITTRDLRRLADIALTMPPGMHNDILKQCPEVELWPYYRFLYLLMHKVHPRIVVECGVYQGSATEHMAIADTNANIIGIDNNPMPRVADVVYRNQNVYMLRGDTVESAYKVTRLLSDWKARIGILFLDSTHDGNTPTREYLAYSQMLSDEAIVVCDDILFPPMIGFWNWLPGDKIELHELHPKPSKDYQDIGFGVSIVRHK